MAVGATTEQASSGLLAVSVTMGVACILLARWTRMPITVAWSTPGAALLATTGVVEGGWPAAVGAFLITGALIVLTGLVPWLGALIASIPASLAPAGVIAAVAGLALLATFATALKAALTETGEQIPAVVTFATAASGIAISGVSAAFWALIAGLVVRFVFQLGRGTA